VKQKEKIIVRVIIAVVIGSAIITPNILSLQKVKAIAMIKNVRLPVPAIEGKVSVEEAIKKRRSRRNFKDKALNLSQISQILWSAQGITEEKGYKRAAPSAGALYPLEIYLVVKKVEKLETGVYHYNPANHSVDLLLRGNYQTSLARACLGQMFIADAPISIVITAQYKRTTGKYGERGIRYVHIEVGHVGQNICLQATALGLGTVPVGAFRDEQVSKVLNLPEEYKPLYVLPIGYPE